MELIYWNWILRDSRWDAKGKNPIHIWRKVQFSFEKWNWRRRNPKWNSAYLVYHLASYMRILNVSKKTWNSKSKAITEDMFLINGACANLDVAPGAAGSWGRAGQAVSTTLYIPFRTLSTTPNYEVWYGLIPLLPHLNLNTMYTVHCTCNIYLIITHSSY